MCVFREAGRHLLQAEELEQLELQAEELALAELGQSAEELEQLELQAEVQGQLELEQAEVQGPLAAVLELPERPAGLLEQLPSAAEPV